MESNRLAIKLFAHEGQGPDAFSREAIVPIFHSWIQTHAVSDHLLIDVADYAHVPNGPGTVLVSHEANFSTDRGGGRTGLLYVRKQPLPGTFAEQLRAVLSTTLAAASLLEDGAKGAVRFRTDEFLLRIYDRLLAPNTIRTFQEVKPELEELLQELYPSGPVTLEHQPCELTLFEVRVKAGESPDLQTLLGRVNVPASAV